MQSIFKMRRYGKKKVKSQKLKIRGNRQIGNSKKSLKLNTRS